MPSIRHNRPLTRAFSLIELIVSLVIILSLMGATFHALATCRRIQKRNEILTALSLRSNAELARMQATPWQDMKAGTRPLADPQMPDTKGEVTIKDVPGLDLKEITVRLSRNPSIGPCEIKISTWRGRQ
jgi:prepilin-type N-terminal cleavage/methylation domain-containing protein